MTQSSERGDPPNVKSYFIDMDGVIVSGNTLIPGAREFINQLTVKGIKFLILTNNPIYTPADLQHRLRALGLNVRAKRFFTSAMATAQFLDSQRPRGTAFAIGESGMETILVLSGVTRPGEVNRFPYQPTHVLPSVAEISV